MNRRLLVSMGLAISLLFCQAAALSAAESTAGIYFYEADRLPAAKALLKGNAKGADAEEVREAAEMLREEANDALRRGPYDVMQKEGIPPSGSKHDYISYSVYWWPDPKKPDGLPFIRRDGKTNHEQRAKGDRDRLEDMIQDVEALALAHYFLEKDKYGQHARKLVRAWFLDEETKMNPHLQYAQAVPGENDGRGSGIIDARDFIELCDALVLLKHTGALSEAEDEALHEWFAAYLKWMLTSDFGKKERRAQNNHGTWYAAQAARVALYVGDEPTARELVEEAQERLAEAVEDDGQQREELERTRSLHYSLFQTTAFVYLARFGESLGVDLWQHDVRDKGPAIRRGLDYALPFVAKQDEWPHEQIDDYKISPQGVQVIRMATLRYDEPKYEQLLAQSPRSDRDRVFAPLLFRGLSRR